MPAALNDRVECLQQPLDLQDRARLDFQLVTNLQPCALGAMPSRVHVFGYDRLPAARAIGGEQMSLFKFIKPKCDMSLAFSLDGIERIIYGETDAVFDRLQAIGAALALFPIKDASPLEPSMEWMYTLTDGMTPEQVRKPSTGSLLKYKLNIIH
jgi:hypothetical protein